MLKRKPLDMSDDILDDPESAYAEHGSLDFDRQDEGRIYESIEDELDLDTEDVLRDLPELEIDLEDIDFGDDGIRFN